MGEEGEHNMGAIVIEIFMGEEGEHNMGAIVIVTLVPLVPRHNLVPRTRLVNGIVLV